MARAAAKRSQRTKQAPRPEPRGRGNRGSSAAIEQTLFFNRLRRNAKWVFVFLALVFSISFVIAGVGSGSTGIGDLFNGNIGSIFGGGGGPSVSKYQKEIAKHPKGAAAYLKLAQAYQAKGDDLSAIGTLESYLRLRPKDLDALRLLAGLYETRVSIQQQEAYQAQQAAQAVAPTTFGPPATTPLGKALSAKPNPISQAIYDQANQTAQQLQSLLQQTYASRESVYARIVKLDPADGSSLLQYGQAAVQAQDYKAALEAFNKFVRLFPDDPTVPQVKKEIKALKAFASLPSQGAPSG